MLVVRCLYFDKNYLLTKLKDDLHPMSWRKTIIYKSFWNYIFKF